MTSVAQACERVARQLGVELRFGTEVQEIAAQQGRAVGIRTTAGDLLQGRAVLFNGDPRRPTPLGSLAKTSVMPPSAPNIDPFPPSPPARFPRSMIVNSTTTPFSSAMITSVSSSNSSTSKSFPPCPLSMSAPKTVQDSTLDPEKRNDCSFWSMHPPSRNLPEPRSTRRVTRPCSRRSVGAAGPRS